MGITNESIARQEYVDRVQDVHDGFCFHSTDLHVNPEYPHLGATPDCSISCQCCGDGLVEIKCPYKYRDVDPTTVVDKSYFLRPDTNGTLSLSRGHNYYIQIQGQLAICGNNFVTSYVGHPMECT